MRSVLSLLAALILLAAPAALRAESEIVIAIRYLQAQGTSHSHLYLYREDGRLIRQLTNDNSGQDSGPIFAPDGAAIVFTREKSDNVKEYWSIEPRGQNVKKLESAPDWYAQAKSSPYFTNIEPEEAVSSTPVASPEQQSSPTPTPVPTYQSPDGSFELVLRDDPRDEDDQVDGPGHGKHFLLRNLKSGTQTEFGKIPGFYGAHDILHDKDNTDRYFFFDGPLRLAFFGLHLNSTDGDTSFALDLTAPRLVRLSPNWASPVPLPGEAAFLTFTENRYVPIPGSSKTANCSYLERWNEKLNHVRYAREKSAAMCYGASMYRPGQDPAVITLKQSAD